MLFIVTLCLIGVILIITLAKNSKNSAYFKKEIIKNRREHNETQKMIGEVWREVAATRKIMEEVDKTPLENTNSETAPEPRPETQKNEPKDDMGITGNEITNAEMAPPFIMLGGGSWTKNYGNMPQEEKKSDQWPGNIWEYEPTSINSILKEEYKPQLEEAKKYWSNPDLKKETPEDDDDYLELEIPTVATNIPDITKELKEAEMEEDDEICSSDDQEKHKQEPPQPKKNDKNNQGLQIERKKVIITPQFSLYPCVDEEDWGTPDTLKQY